MSQDWRPAAAPPRKTSIETTHRPMNENSGPMLLDRGWMGVSVASLTGSSFQGAG